MNDQTITADDLTKLGINLDGQDVSTLLDHANDMLEEKIGEELVEYLDDNQLEEFAQMQESASDEEVGKWLAERIPDLEDIISDNIDIVLGELAENADSINEAE